MKFNRTDILEIGKNNKILKINIRLKNFLFQGRMQEKTVLDSYIRNKKINRKIFIMCGEEIYIKKLTIPNLNGEILEKAIKDELKFYYRVSEEIVFSYNILKKNKNNIDLMIFYINSERLNKFDIKKLYNVKAIYMVQFLYIQYINKIIDYKNYLLAFIHDKYIYLIYCQDKMLKANVVIENFNANEIELKKHILNFCNSNNISSSLMEKLILVGLNLDEIKSLDMEYDIKNLGYLEKSQIYGPLGT